MRKGIDCKGRAWDEKKLSGYMKNIAGMRFGRLVALFPVKYNNKAYWLCKCDCGNEIIVIHNALSSKNTQSCGCLHSDIVKQRWDDFREENNIIGQRFGRLVVVEFIGIKADESVYRFKCDCGNEVIRTLHNVKSGNTKSCGCLFEDFIDSYKSDLIGQRFGKLVVTSWVGVDQWGQNQYNCFCDCGDNVIVSRNSLMTNNVQSCGCLISVGENNIKEILDHENIKYKRQYKFCDLFSISGRLLPYDFAILDDNNQVVRLIEFDGSQHERPYDYFGGTSKFVKVQENDALKNQYALSHNIPLVRIPYTKRDNITLECLLGDKFLIKGEK